MKSCQRFHIEDVEPGDVLTLSPDGIREWEGPEQFDLTVKQVYRTHNFGWVIKSKEKIGPDEEDTFYVEDPWGIQLKLGEEPSA